MLQAYCNKEFLVIRLVNRLAVYAFCDISVARHMKSICKSSALKVINPKLADIIVFKRCLNSHKVQLLYFKYQNENVCFETLEESLDVTKQLILGEEEV